MDCGAWHNNERIPIVVRIKGCEFGMTGADLSELCSHLIAVRDGAKESLSEDYKDYGIRQKNEAKGTSLIKLLGLDKQKPKPPALVGLPRRI